MKTTPMKIFAGAALILMTTSLAACSKSKSQQSATQISDKTPITQAEASQATTSFSIDKMTCASCPISVRKAMMRVDGVKSVKVDFKTKIATVVYDKTKTTPASIAAASTNVGYPANEVVG